MSFLLKIVEGPNKGAEIALVDGVAVTLGKGDGCDIVLADPTMPDTPLRLEASADGVTVDGEPLEEFHVRTSGATSFAVGPSDAPWGALSWPKAEEAAPEARAADDGRTEDAPPQAPRPAAEEPAAAEQPAGKRGRPGCLLALILLLLILAALAWFFRGRIRTYAATLREKAGISGKASPVAEPSVSDLRASTLSAIADKYGLSLAESNGVTHVSGNFATRRERLAATAEAYQAMPGVELDLSDDESFRTSAEDALFALTEGALKVSAATNRVLSITGSAPSPQSLQKTLLALNSDLAKLNGIDFSGVIVGGMKVEGLDTVVAVAEERGPEARPSIQRDRKAPAARESLPVCGILTTPYPCLVMRDGRRLIEGAAIGESVILEISADSVVLTNSTGRFTWKP